MILEKLFRAEITLAPPQELGDTPLGRRRIIGITGGRFAGERLSGRVLTVNAATPRSTGHAVHHPA